MMIDISKINYFNTTKLLIVLLITVVATTSFISQGKHYQYLNSQLTKTILLFMIIIVLYIDIHLGLLLLTLFIIILVQLNHSVIKDAHVKIETFRMLNYNNHEPICDVGGQQREELSADHLEYTLDDKVKPYDVFIKMLTNQKHLDSASNAAILQ